MFEVTVKDFKLKNCTKSVDVLEVICHYFTLKYKSLNVTYSLFVYSISILD